MRLICPACGTISSAETFANDDLCRQALAKVASLPGPLPQATLGYISLFRTTGAGRGLGWKKVLRLVSEIDALVAKGYVHVQGRVDRPCGPATWARGMEQMVEQRLTLRLPMESHGYLEKVVWDLADKVDAQREYSRQPSSPTRTPQGPQHIAAVLSPLDQYIQGQRDTKPTDEEMAAWKKARMNE